MSPIEEFLKSPGRLRVTAYTEDWGQFNAQLRALGQLGVIERVAKIGPWNDRFDSVEGRIDGTLVVLTSPRYRDEETPAAALEHGKGQVDWRSAERELVRQVAAELREQAA